MDCVGGTLRMSWIHLMIDTGAFSSFGCGYTMICQALEFKRSVEMKRAEKEQKQLNAE